MGTAIPSTPPPLPRSLPVLPLLLLLVATMASYSRQNSLVEAQFADGFGGGAAAVEPPQFRLNNNRGAPSGSPLSPLHRLYGRARDHLDDQLDAFKVQTFGLFTKLFNKTYSAREFPRRLALFVRRRRLVEHSVRLFREGKSSFMLRENAFLDWYREELRRLASVRAPRTYAELFAEEREALATAYANGGAYYRTPAAGPLNPVVRRFKRDLLDYERDRGGDDDDDSLANMTVGVQQQQQQLRSAAPQPDGKFRIPMRVDWRRSGCVAEPVNQRDCGACYAIATMSTLESMHCLNGAPGATTLAAQQLVDCSTNYKNQGCDGGWPTATLKYLQDVHWVARAGCYPFEWRQNQCRTGQVYQAYSGQCFAAASSAGEERLRFKVLTSERDMLYHVARTGPVLAVMQTTDSFLYYGTGVFDDPSCSRERDAVDHAVVIVGYGRERGQDYWLVKNSWGAADWGEQGYAKVRRGVNACSLGHWAWVLLN